MELALCRARSVHPKADRPELTRRGSNTATRTRGTARVFRLYQTPFQTNLSICVFVRPSPFFASDESPRLYTNASATSRRRIPGHHILSRAPPFSPSSSRTSASVTRSMLTAGTRICRKGELILRRCASAIAYGARRATTVQVSPYAVWQRPYKSPVVTFALNEATS